MYRATQADPSRPYSNGRGTNDTHRIETIRLGALAGVDSGTRGTYYFDTFESRRVNYIGP